MMAGRTHEAENIFRRCARLSAATSAAPSGRARKAGDVFKKWSIGIKSCGICRRARSSGEWGAEN